MRRRLARSAFVWFACSAASYSAYSACSAAAAQQPTFRSTVDLVPVDVNVLDKEGRPVGNLTAADFTLQVDGKPRRIASAQFISVERAMEPDRLPSREYSSNAGAGAGRLIMLVVDAGNIGTGRGKPAIEAAQRFVGSLNRADRVALVTIPGAGPQIDFTANHAVVQKLLEGIVGQAGERIGPQRIGLSEALAFQKNHEQTIQEVRERECSADPTPELKARCQQEIANEADSLLSLAKERTRSSLIALRYVFERIATSDTPKTVVLISEGLLLDRQNADVGWVGPRAAAGHIILYVMQVDSPEIDAFRARTSPSRNDDREVLRQGLDQLAGLARGDVFRIVANPDFAFQRLGLELSGYYLLSFEPQEGDRDGKPHKIKIDVKRSGLLLRARREFSVGPPASRSRDAIVGDTLKSPLVASDIPLRVTTYTFSDLESKKLKIVLAADVDRSLNPNDTLSLGYAMYDGDGKLVSSRLEQTLEAPIDKERKLQTYMGAAVAAPGTYTLKVAVVDENGKRGSVEHTFTAKINGFGQLHTSDLLIADSGMRSGGTLPPAVAADFSGDELHGFIELVSEVPEQLKNASVVIEIAKDESARPLEGIAARFQPQATGEFRRVAEAGVPIALLPPGEYVARAVITVSGKRVGQVIRPFRIVARGGSPQ